MHQENSTGLQDSQVVSITNIQASGNDEGQVIVVNKRKDRTPEFVLLFQTTEQFKLFAEDLSAQAKKLK